jgi:pentapeptide MXKDX repeat protein
MANTTRIALGTAAAFVSLGLVFAPAAFAQDKMSKDGMKKEDTMSKDGMKKDATKGDSMKKGDAMSKDGMKKDEMKK